MYIGQVIRDVGTRLGNKCDASPRRAVYRFYAKGSTYEAMHEHNREARSEWAEYVPNTPFKYIVGGYNRSISQSRQREIIESFGYMDLLGKIDMKNPAVTFGCFEECG